MSEEIVPQVFESSEFGTIRAMRGNDGEPWFVAKDVCDALGIRTDTVRTILDDDEVRETNPNSIGVAGGRNPLMRAFAQWVALLVERMRKADREANE